MKVEVVPIENYDNDTDSNEDQSASTPNLASGDSLSNCRSEHSQKNYNFKPIKQVNYAFQTLGKKNLPEYKHIKSSKKRAKDNAKKSKAK